MPWRVADPHRYFDAWAEGKSEQERLVILNGLIELADRPLTELPGLRQPNRSPMSRWTIIGSTIARIHVYESAGWFDLTDLRDF